MVGEVVAEVEVLLDKDGGHVAFSFQVFDDAANLLDDVGLDALGRLIEQQDFRAHDHGTGDGELLLLAAGKIAAAARGHIFEDGNRS